MDGDDLLIEEIPDDEVPLPMPEDMPPVPTIEIDEEFYEGRSLLSRLKIFQGMILGRILRYYKIEAMSMQY